MADKQAVLGSGAKFTGKITHAKSIEINGFVQADLATEKVTIGSTGKSPGRTWHLCHVTWILQTYIASNTLITSCNLHTVNISHSWLVSSLLVCVAF